MKAVRNLLIATLLAAPPGSVFAEGNWQFELDIGQPWIECNPGYTGSTADALGCSAIGPSARVPAQPPLLNLQADESGVLELASSARPGIPSMGVNGKDLNELWTLADGERLGFGQVMVSAFLHQYTGETDSEPVPSVLVTKESLASPFEVEVDSTPRTNEELMRITTQTLEVNKRPPEDFLGDLVQFSPGS